MKIDTIYLENEIKDHEKAVKILSKISYKRIVSIERYGEVFNRKNQNFVLQKINPALILAKKRASFIQKIKPQSGVGLKENYYFSPILNCPYDCGYCFLQGFFRSAFYTLFVNYEDFKFEIESIKTPSFFFSGYDCDSLALDHLTDFSSEFLPFFQSLPNHYLELRTKSTNIKNLLLLKEKENNAFNNVILSFSLNPDKVIDEVEKKTPSLDQRLSAIEKLQKNGYQIGLRFDPIVYHQGYKQSYSSMFNKVFDKVDLSSIHSVTIGAIRLPKSCYKNILRTNVNNPLMACLYENSLTIFSYEEKLLLEMIDFCHSEIAQHIQANKIYIYRDCS